MFYIRSTKDTQKARPISVRAARAGSVFALAAYPPGAFLLGASGGLPVKVAGAALLVATLGSAGMLATTWVQRIVGELPQYLDEFEMQVRLRAMQAAYATFTLLVLGFVMYSAVAVDTQLWVPRTYRAYDAVFWGVFLYAWLLPTAFVAWRIEEDEAGQGARP